MWGVELTVMLAMIVINSIFAAYEIALASVGLARLDTLTREKRRGAQAAFRMKGNMEGSLAVVQLGITLVGMIAAATGGAGAEETIEPVFRAWGLRPGAAQFLAIATVVIPLTVVTIVFGELVPKIFALRNKEWVCLQLSPLMTWFALSVWPAVWVLEHSVSAITRWGEKLWKPREHHAEAADAATHHLQELRAIAAMARMSRLIGIREEGIIVNAARLSSTPVRGIMLPAHYISMLNADDTLADSLIAAHHDMHTRFPVTSTPGDAQGIIGYVNFKDIVAMLRLSPDEASLRGILRPLPSFHEDMTVANCLERLIHDRNHIALVRNEAHEVLGMMTLEDVLEELVGEIHDEYDRLPSYITTSGHGWIVGGQAGLLHLREVTGLEFPTYDWSPPPATLNDWVLKKLGGPVKGGEIIAADGIRIVVRKVRRQLVSEAQISRHSSQEHQQPPDADSPAA